MNPPADNALQLADAKGFLLCPACFTRAGFVCGGKPHVTMRHCISACPEGVILATITHEQLSARLQELQLPVTADALHGTLAGLACAGMDPGSADWLEQLSECLDGADLAAHREAMVALHTLVARDLADGELGFQPMLPDGDEFLSVRAQALARWSEGFICGFVAVQRTLSSDDREVLDDIAAISQLDGEDSLADAALNRAGLNDPASADSNERDFMELCEYVRLAAMDLYREGQTASPVQGDA